MITTRRMVLEEITFEMYLDRKQKLGIKPRRNAPIPQNTGFADIVKPLVFEDFEHLLRCFRKTPDANRASVKGESDWVRRDARKLYEKNIKFMSDIAREKGFMYINFYNTHENEIAFEPLDDKVVSMNITLEGDKKHMYSWHGPCGDYKRIHGIYVPKSFN